jgi:hypothetical protein
LAAGVKRKLDVPKAGDSEAAALGVASQGAPAADLFLEFVDGHGWLVLVDGGKLSAGCTSATIKSPPAKNNPQAGESATNSTARAAGCQG